MPRKARPAPEAREKPPRRRRAADGEPPHHVLFETAIGACGVAYGPGGVLAVFLPSHSEAATERALAALARHRTGVASTRRDAPPPEIATLCAKLREHLAGHAQTFDDATLDLSGLSDFRRAVYDAARKIPSGQVRTYAELAKAAGSASAARAVGRALATNPFPIVVPCHRVLGSEHDLHGFSAPGGLKTKAALLALEGASLGHAVKQDKAPDAAPDPRQGSLPFDP